MGHRDHPGRAWVSATTGWRYSQKTGFGDCFVACSISHSTFSFFFLLVPCTRFGLLRVCMGEWIPTTTSSPTRNIVPRLRENRTAPITCLLSLAMPIAEARRQCLVGRVRRRGPGHGLSADALMREVAYCVQIGASGRRTEAYDISTSSILSRPSFASSKSSTERP